MRRAFQLIVAVITLAIAASGRADALEITCVESSRYRHLYQLFGGDPKQLAAFLGLDPAALPRPEHCRAILLSGKVDTRSANDADKLLAAIDANQGWLTALHLSSSGGIVQTGYQLGFITRLFWLKTRTAPALGRNLNYTPDFFVPPAAAGPDTDVEQPDAERIRNWRSYLTTQKGLSPVPLGYVGCASACGLIHTAGVDRSGEVRVHRARVGGAGKDEFINLKATMSETDKRLQRLELEQIAFYRQMDPGPDFVRHYQETPAQTLTPVDVSRFPRYVADYLTGKCKVNGDQLQALDRQIGGTIAELGAPQFGYRIKTDNLRRSLRQLRHLRADAERCIAAAHESERRSHFAKLCPNGCDRKKLMGMVEENVRGLGLALLVAPALLSSSPNPAAAALEFHCIEASRYKNLLQIFHDDPSTFFSYFNISRRPLPLPESCRALLVTGTIAPDSADALLGRVIEGRGWLAALYLSFSGTNIEQETAMATIVRQFSLKTYEVRGPVYFYHPDFAVAWTPAIGKGGFLSAAASGDPSPLDSGLAAFLRRDRALKLDPKRYACAGGCRVVWSAGANRVHNLRSGPADATTTTDQTIERLRSVFAYRLDRGRLPAADDPTLSRPWDRIPTTPPAVAATLRKECDAEMTVAEALESRVADVFTEAARRRLTPSAVASLAPHLNALKRAGVRLQQCLAAAHENLRLRNFRTHCPKTCSRAELLGSLSKSAAEMLEEAGTL